MVGQIVSKPENGHNNERLRLCVFEVAVPIVSSNGLLECWSAIDYGVEKSLLNNNIQVQEEDKNLHGIRSHFLDDPGFEEKLNDEYQLHGEHILEMQLLDKLG
uniref:Uncharacterized protein n=1 Tax=Anopheles albimanus TaxID=7167 RepID=A0A182F9H4_ANOAL